jgi:hypothetical protein
MKMKEEPPTRPDPREASRVANVARTCETMYNTCMNAKNQLY